MRLLSLIAGIPDPPTNLTLVNATHNSITFSWIPGFDGGSEQSFRILYGKSSSRHPKLSEAADTKYDHNSRLLYDEQQQNDINDRSLASPEKSNLTTVFIPSGRSIATMSDLEPGSEYLLFVSSKNKHGESKPSEKPLRVKTNPAPVELFRSFQHPASVSASDEQLSSDLPAYGINLPFLIAGSTISLISLVLFSAVFRYYRRKAPAIIRDSNPPGSNGNSEEFSISNHPGDHRRYMQTETTEPAPYIIGTDSVAPCKCDSLPMLTVALSKHHHQMVECDSNKCYSLSSEFTKLV